MVGVLVAVVVLVPQAGPELLVTRVGYVRTGALSSVHATQAAATDGHLVYAVSSTAVVKYDRDSGKELGVSQGKAEHLNSAFVHEGKVYCAHSNYPKKPHQSDVRVLDPVTMRLEIFHRFRDPPGSLTWVVRRGEFWWCHFAHYEADNARSVLVKYDTEWREVSRWTYPKELVADWGRFSLSGGMWQGEDLLATGHDRKVIYRLGIPAKGTTVELREVIGSPFPGQGIASDGRAGLVGIDRGKQQVIFARPRP